MKNELIIKTGAGIFSMGGFLSIAMTVEETPYIVSSLVLLGVTSVVSYFRGNQILQMSEG